MTTPTVMGTPPRMSERLARLCLLLRPDWSRPVDWQVRFATTRELEAAVRAMVRLHVAELHELDQALLERLPTACRLRQGRRYHELHATFPERLPSIAAVEEIARLKLHHRRTP